MMPMTSDRLDSQPGQSHSAPPLLSADSWRANRPEVDFSAPPLATRAGSDGDDLLSDAAGPARTRLPEPDENSQEPGRRERRTYARFGGTVWTSILQRDLEALCAAYWMPLYAYLRRRGRSPHDAEDLVQGFLAHFLAKDSRLQSAHPSKGRFRSFLLACLNRYVANRDKYDRRRWPKQRLVSINAEEGEAGYTGDTLGHCDAEQTYDRAWAETLVRHAIDSLRQKWCRTGASSLFEALLPFLNGEAKRGDHARVARHHGTTEEALRAAVCRLRRDYREVLLREIRRTVDSTSEADAELRYLFSRFGA